MGLFSLKISTMTKPGRLKRSITKSAPKWPFDLKLNRHLFYMDHHLQGSGKVQCERQTAAASTLLLLV